MGLGLRDSEFPLRREFAESAVQHLCNNCCCKLMQYDLGLPVASIPIITPKTDFAQIPNSRLTS